LYEEEEKQVISIGKLYTVPAAIEFQQSMIWSFKLKLLYEFNQNKKKIDFWHTVSTVMVADEASSYYGMCGCEKKMKKEKEFEKRESEKNERCEKKNRVNLSAVW
jgi:hypothetical protein